MHKVYWETPRGGYGDVPCRRRKTTFWVKSGPNYIGKDGPHHTLDEAIEAANKRAYWRFIVNQAGIVVHRNPKYEAIQKQINA